MILNLIFYRAQNLSKDAVDITPKNGQAFPWAGKDVTKFE
jgi:hypothetical protein